MQISRGLRTIYNIFKTEAVNQRPYVQISSLLLQNHKHCTKIFFVKVRIHFPSFYLKEEHPF